MGVASFWESLHDAERFVFEEMFLPMTDGTFMPKATFSNYDTLYLSTNILTLLKGQTVEIPSTESIEIEISKHLVRQKKSHVLDVVEKDKSMKFRRRMGKSHQRSDRLTFYEANTINEALVAASDLAILQIMAKEKAINNSDSVEKKAALIEEIVIIEQKMNNLNSHLQLLSSEIQELNEVIAAAKTGRKSLKSRCDNLINGALKMELRASIQTQKGEQRIAIENKCAEATDIVNKEKLQAREVEIQKSLDDCKNIMGNISVLEQSIKSIEEKIAVEKQKIEIIIANNAKKTQFAKDCKDLEAKLAKITMEMDKQRNSIRNATANIECLKKKSLSLSTDKAGAELSINGLKQKIQDLLNLKKTVNATLNGLSREKDAITSYYLVNLKKNNPWASIGRGMLMAATLGVSELSIQSNLKEQVKNVDERITAHKTKISDYDVKISLDEANLVQAQAKLVQIDQQVAAIATDVNQWKTNITTSEVEIKKFESQQKDYVIKLTLLKKSHDAILDTSTAKLESEIRILTLDLEQKNSRIKWEQSQLRLKENALTILRQEVSKLTSASLTVSPTGKSIVRTTFTAPIRSGVLQQPILPNIEEALEKLRAKQKEQEAAKKHLFTLKLRLEVAEASLLRLESARELDAAIQDELEVLWGKRERQGRSLSLLQEMNIVNLSCTLHGYFNTDSAKLRSLAQCIFGSIYEDVSMPIFSLVDPHQNTICKLDFEQRLQQIDQTIVLGNDDKVTPEVLGRVVDVIYSDTKCQRKNFILLSHTSLFENSEIVLDSDVFIFEKDGNYLELRRQCANVDACVAFRQYINDLMQHETLSHLSELCYLEWKSSSVISDFTPQELLDILLYIEKDISEGCVSVEKSFLEYIRNVSMEASADQVLSIAIRNLATLFYSQKEYSDEYVHMKECLLLLRSVFIDRMKDVIQTVVAMKQRDIATFKDNALYLQNESESLVAAKTAEVESLQSEISELQKGLDETIIAIAELKDAKKRVLAQYSLDEADLNKEISQLEEKVARLKKMDDGKDAAAGLKRVAESKSRDLELLQQKRKAQMESRAALQKSYDALNEEIKSMEKQQSSAEDSKRELTEKYENLKVIIRERAVLLKEVSEWKEFLEKVILYSLQTDKSVFKRRKDIHTIIFGNEMDITKVLSSLKTIPAFASGIDKYLKSFNALKAVPSKSKERVEQLRKFCEEVLVAPTLSETTTTSGKEEVRICQITGFSLNYKEVEAELQSHVLRVLGKMRMKLSTAQKLEADKEDMKFGDLLDSISSHNDLAKLFNEAIQAKLLIKDIKLDDTTKRILRSTTVLIEMNTKYWVTAKQPKY